jgi:hypothetical protein
LQARENIRDGFIIKGSLCSLLSCVYVDRDPFRAVSLPRLYRDADSGATGTADHDDARHFPCSPFATDLLDVCDYTTKYISDLPGSTKLFQVSRVGGWLESADKSMLVQSVAGEFTVFGAWDGCYTLARVIVQLRGRGGGVGALPVPLSLSCRQFGWPRLRQVL